MSTDTVTVACKLPVGLLCTVVDMKHYETQRKEAIAGRPITTREIGRFRLRGYQEARKTDSAGSVQTESRNVIGLFGLTPNVPKDLWDAWLAQSQDYPPVKSGLIFAHVEAASARDYAKEHAELSTGMDALDPMKPAKGIKPEGFEGMTQAQRDDVERGMPAYTG